MSEDDVSVNSIYYYLTVDNIYGKMMPLKSS